MEEKIDAVAVQGDLRYALTVLAVPTLITQITLTIGGLGETYFVKRLGDEAIAAVGSVGQVNWLLMVLVMMLSTGATTMLAQRWGASDLNGAQRVTTATLQQGLLFGFLAMTLWFFKDLIWDWLGIPPKVRELATVYFAVFLFVCPLAGMEFGMMSLYRGIGDMVTPMYSMLAGVASQLLMCALFVPVLGIVGVALAFVLSRIVILIWLLARYRSSQLRLVSLRVNGWYPEEHRQLLALGIPSGVQSFLWSLASTIYFGILSHTKESTAAIAALTAGLRIEALAFMPGIAFGIAAQTLVGQNIGAGQMKRARKGAWQAALWCSVIMGIVGAVFFFSADWLAMKFSNEALTRHYIAAYLKINAISEPFLGLGMTLGGALRGAGDTITPAVITVGTQWLLRLPATYVLCHYLGYDAVAAWWTMSLSTIVSGVLTALIFARRKFLAPVFANRS